MPALRIFGSAWAFASDEVFCIATPFVLLRCVGIFTLVTAFSGLQQYSATCPPGLDQLQQLWSIDGNCPIERLLGYFTVAAALQVLIVAVELIGATVAQRGAVMNERPRRCIVPLLYVHGLTLLVEVPAAVIGVNFAYSGSNFAYDGSDEGTDVDHCWSCLPGNSSAVTTEALDELYGSIETSAAALRVVTVVQAVITCITLCRVRRMCPSPPIDTSTDGNSQNDSFPLIVFFKRRFSARFANEKLWLDQGCTHGGRASCRLTSNHQHDLIFRDISDRLPAFPKHSH